MSPTSRLPVEGEAPDKHFSPRRTDRRWRLPKDPFPALSHWLGAALSLAGLVVLLARTAHRPWWEIASFAVYGVTLIQLFAASALAHSFDASPEVEQWYTRFDYVSIFLLIAGSYTPICVVALPRPGGLLLLAAVWITAAFGIVNLFRKSAGHLGRVLTYVAMGWLGVAAAGPLIHVLPAAAVAWILAGGLLYTVGAAVFFTDRPHLWPGRFAAHDLWHCMVLAGSACHFVAILRFVVPA